MDKLIEQLREHKNALETLILMLEGQFPREFIEGSLLISEQIKPYAKEGKEIQKLINLIISDHGKQHLEYINEP